MSTASAINATLFASARLARRVASDRQLPSFVTRWEVGGVPAGFLLGTALAAGLFQWFGSLEEIATFASLVFLLVFAAVNAAALAHRVFAGPARVIPAVGGLGCLLSAGVLLLDTRRNDPGTLLVIGIVAACVLVARLLFTLLHHEFRERSGEGPAKA
jgi:hypothetical protein